MRILAALAVLLASASAAAQTGTGTCLEVLARIERPEGVILPPDTLSDLRTMAAETVAFAEVGNEAACRIRVGQIVSILENYVPDANALEDHRARLQTARPWEPDRLLPEDEIDDVDVWSPTGEWLGEAEGMTPDYLLVTRSGWFGLGRDVVAVPLGLVHVTDDGDDLVLPVNESTFIQAPSFADDEDVEEEATILAEADRFWRAVAVR